MAENVALANQLQAIQLGASLYDRAQTQKRLMEQLQLQTADQLMRQKQADLQNRIQSNAFAQALQEQTNQENEFDAFQSFNQGVSDFLNSTTPGAKIPAIPKFKSKLFNQQAMQLINGLERYSARSELIRQQEKAAAFKETLEAERIKDARKYNSFTRTDDGNYVIDDQKIAEKKAEEERLNKASKTALTGSKFTKESLKQALDNGDITQEEYNQYLPSARTEGGITGQLINKQISGLEKQGVITNEDEKAEAEAFLSGPDRGKAPTDVLKSINLANGAILDLNDAFKKIQDFEKNYGKNSFSEFVGPLDNPLFEAKGRFKGITSKQQEDARSIFNKIRLVVNDYQSNKYGATLTPAEISNLEKVVSNPSRADYINVINAFKDNLTSGIENRVWDYRYSPSIVPDIKKRYLPGIKSKMGLMVIPETANAPTMTIQSPQGVTNAPTVLRFDSQGNLIQ